jgi:hypothetical protein
MTNELTLDEVLFEFHKAIDIPTPEVVTRWTLDYPQFADDIRAHAVEIIDMEALAAAAESAVACTEAPPKTATGGVERVAGTLREVIGSVGLSLPRFADELGIARSIVADVNSGRILVSTVPRRFLRLAAARLDQAIDVLADIVGGQKETVAAAMLKAVSGPTAGRPVTWAEAVQASDMDDERKAFWLSED